MNCVDCVVTKVKSDPKKDNYGFWFVEVDFGSYGHLSSTTLYFDTKRDAEKVKVGYKFLH